MSDSPLFEILDFRGILQFQTLTRRMQVYSSLNILYCDLSLVGSSVLFFFFFVVPGLVQSKEEKILLENVVLP